MTGSCNQHLWAPEEDEQLRVLLRDRPELTYLQLAEEMGRTKNQVVQRRKRLKLRKAHYIPNGWASEKHAKLCALHHEGWPTAEIGRRMGITKNAVIGRLHRTGLCCSRDPQLPPWDHFDMLHYLMNLALAASASIPRLPVPAKPHAGKVACHARQGDGFGVRALGYGQNGSRAVAGSSGDF